MIVFSAPPFIKRVAEAAKVRYIPNYDQGIFRVGKDGDLMGGAVFTDYTGASAQIHVAGFHPNWLNRELIYVTFDFAFHKLKLKKLIGVVNETNERAFIFDKHIGFKDEARIEDLFPEGAGLILSLSKEDCRYIKNPPKQLREKWNFGEVT